MYPGYKIPPVRDANGNLLLILSAVIIRIRFESAVNKNIFLVANYFSVKELIGTRYMNHHVESIRCINRQVELTNRKHLPIGSAPYVPTIRGLESMEHDYSRLTAGKPSEKIDFYPDIMRHEVALCKHVTLFPYKQVWVTVVTNISDQIYTEPKTFLWTRRPVRPANEILEVVANTSVRQNFYFLQFATELF